MITSAAGLLLLQAAAPTPGGSMTGLIFQIAAIIAIFYFIMLRPQQKQRKQREATLSALKRGDEIVTTGGIVGEIQVQVIEHFGHEPESVNALPDLVRTVLHH